MDYLKNSAINSLKWLEQYTKTDMVYLAKGGFWLGLGQTISTASVFITSIAFANLISPDAYGIYKFVLSINSVLLITTLTGMDSAITQSVARGFEGTLQIGASEKRKWGYIGSFISLLISSYYFFNGNEILAICFAIVSFFIPFTESRDTYNSLLWGKKLFNIQAKYNAINILIITVGTLSVLYFTKNLYYILLTYLLCLTIPNFFFFRNTEKFYQTNKNIDPEAIGYGKHLSLINLFGLIVYQLDKILIFQQIDAVSLAVYSLALAPADQIKGLLKNINSLAIPKFSKKTLEEIEGNIWNKVWILFFILIFFIGFYVLIAPSLFKVFFPKYLASIPYSQIISISVIPIIIAEFLSTIFVSQKETNKLYEYNLHANISYLVLLVPLIYFFGIWGAILARFINRLFILFVAIRLLKK